MKPSIAFLEGTPLYLVIMFIYFPCFLLLFDDIDLSSLLLFSKHLHSVANMCIYIILKFLLQFSFTRHFSI